MVQLTVDGGGYMLCKIYRTTFELNNSKKLRRVIASLSDGPYRYDNYYYCKPNVLEPIMRPYNFHFNEWELIISNFNPELHEHWTYLGRSVCCGLQSIKDIDFLNEWSAEWMPRDAKKRLATSYTVYKIVDENNNIIDTTPYIEHYLETLHQRWQERCNPQKTTQKESSARDFYFLRHPHTTNEKKQAISPEDIRWMQENGYHIKQRGRRKNLPSVYDDNLVDIPRCWKDRTKQSTQYNSNLKAKHKKCRGYYQ